MSKKVLVVDDSHMIRRIVGKLLQECDYDVVTAENGQAGLDMARQARPDLIIMDIEMPVMNGIRATEAIRSDRSIAHIPVLIFTSLGSEEDMRMAREAGGSGFLNKPISREELKASVSFLLDADGRGPA